MTKLLFLFAFVTACGMNPSTGTTTDGSGSTSSAACGSDTSLTYDNFGSAFIATNCLSCHAARAQPQLSTLAEVQANGSRILQVAVNSTKMPQNAALSTDERQMLGEWLQCGAP